jgi:2,3-bisphosphoglycerate-dependent phosphoglycerate mutase
MAPATLLLVRHGETAWNAAHRIQGSQEVPLSTTGTWQAGRLAQRLASEPIDAIVASDQARAWMTAAPTAAALGLEVQAEPRLRERRFGLFEGLTLDEAAARHPDEFALWRSRRVDWVIPGGESAQQFIERVLAALADLAAQYSGRTLLLVSHGGVLDVIYRHAQRLDWAAPRAHLMLNAALNRLALHATPFALYLLQWGDDAHLVGARDELAAGSPRA